MLDNKLTTSPSSIDQEEDCQTKRWWHKDEGGTGIVPIAEAAYFAQGRAIHADLADIAKGTSLEDVQDQIDDTAPTIGANQEFIEVWARRLGIATAFGLYIWPLWDAEYIVEATERNVRLSRPPLDIAGVVDLILRRRSNGHLVIKDYKTVKILGREWINHWAYSSQMHIYLKATEETLNEKVDYAHVVGIQKGQDRGGKLRHPYVYAYSNGKEWSTDWKKDWDLVGTWEYPGGVVAWVAHLGPSQAYELFPCSAPVMLNERILDKLIRTQTAREIEVSQYREACQTDYDLRDLMFVPSHSKCRPSFGSECEFLAACHNAEVNRNPIGSGLYVRRERT